MSVDQRGADERRLAVGAARTLGILAVPAVVISGLIAGFEGAVSAIVGIVFVLALFAGSAALLSWTVARNPAAAMGALVAGFVVRLPLYVIALAVLDGLSWIHGYSLAFTTVAAVVVTQVYETRAISRSPRLSWVEPAAASSAATPNATRSESL